MKLTQNTRVQFDEAAHTYLADGINYLSGVTGLLKRQGLAPDYGDIDEETLNAAAARGTDLHKAIQAYLTGSFYLPDNEDTFRLLDMFKTLQNNFIASEYLVSDNLAYATQIDIVEQTGESEVVLWDIKRTSQLHYDSVKWQLSVEAFLFEKQNPGLKVVGLKALHLRDQMKEVELPRVKDTEVARLLDADRHFQHYEPEEAPLDIQGVAGLIARKFQEIEAKEADLKAMKEDLEREKESIRAYMEKEGLKSWECAGVKMTRILATTRTTLDSKKVKELYPEAYDACLKVAEVKESLKITRTSTKS